jgi:hypothetical protein
MSLVVYARSREHNGKYRTFPILFIEMTILVSSRSEAYNFTAWILRSWIRVPLKVWEIVVVFVLCCSVL